MSTQHKQYVSEVAEQMNKWLRRKSRPLSDAWRIAALVLMHLDLQPAQKHLLPLYAPSDRGRKRYDPVVMLRALILMVLLQFESISKWAAALATYPRLAKIAGFTDKIPVAGTFYAFINRLEDGAYQKPCDHRIKPSDMRRGMHQRNLASEQEQRHQDSKRAKSEYDSVTQKLKEQLLSELEIPRQQDLLYRLEEILIECAVIPSAEFGLLGDLNELIVCGDGSSLVSAANGNGKPICECRSQGIYRCECDRLYADSTANWGYDSYRDCYYFGHTYYQHVISTKGHDLPIHINIGPASETDFTLSLYGLNRLQKALASHRLDWKLTHVVYDAGHDALGIYEYLCESSIAAVIALNPRSESFSASGTAENVDAEGRPICPAGLVMRRHSEHRTRHRIYYNCPVKRPTHRNGEHVWKTDVDKCPLGVLCQPNTKMGPVVYVKTDSDPRLYPPIPRSSPKFKKLMNLRSGCERSNSLKKTTYKLANRVARSSANYLVRLYMVSIVEHAKVWAASAIEAIGDDADKFVEYVSQMLNTD